MKRTLLVAVGALVALSALTGCGSPESAPTPTASPRVTEAQTAEPNGTTLLELRDMYVDAGGQCANPQRRAESTVAEDSADCEDGALLSVYRSQTQRDSAISVLEGLQVSNPSPGVIAVGPDWIVNDRDAGVFAEAMGGEALQIGIPVAPVDPSVDLSTDAGLCAADAEMTNLELNDALAPLLGFPADRDTRTPDQDDAIRAHKNAAFARECPARVG